MLAQRCQFKSTYSTTALVIMLGHITSTVRHSRARKVPVVTSQRACRMQGILKIQKIIFRLFVQKHDCSNSVLLSVARSHFNETHHNKEHALNKNFRDLGFRLFATDFSLIMERTLTLSEESASSHL